MITAAPSTQRILIAEDDDEMRRLLVRALSRDGYEVVAVAAGQPLLHALTSGAGPRQFALVISDLRMPGMSGLEVVRELRARGSRLPVLLMTAFGGEDTLIEARKLEVTAVFAKPFDVDDLRTAVLHFLRSEN